MGRKTYLSLGCTLDQRVNVILTRDAEFRVPGAIICHDVAEVLDLCGSEQCFVIGGAQIFRLFLPWATRIYLTRIDAAFEGDTYFPEVDWSDWELVFYETASLESGIQLCFTEYQHRY